MAMGRKFFTSRGCLGSPFELDPDREVQLENKYGGAAGVRLDFYEWGKTVEIHINQGKVRLICQRSN